LPTFPNTLYYGDNLEVLRRYIKDETVDLVYLDPPFNSNQDYNVLCAEKGGIRSAAQIRAFEDTWRWDQGVALVYQQTVEAGGVAPVPLTDTIRDNQDSPPSEVLRSGLASLALCRYSSHRADVHWLNGKEGSS
jgi:hypothetical protein